jgi:hypothetical protein
VNHSMIYAGSNLTNRLLSADNNKLNCALTSLNP